MVALLSLVMGDRRKEGCHMSQRGALYFSLKSWVIERWNIEPIDVGKVSNGQRPWSPEMRLWYSKVPFSLSILERLSRDPLWGKIKSRKGLPGANLSLQTIEGWYQGWGPVARIDYAVTPNNFTSNSWNNQTCNVFLTVLLSVSCLTVFCILWGFCKKKNILFIFFVIFFFYFFSPLSFF